MSDTATLSPPAPVSGGRIRPRLLTHRGVVQASALLFDTRLLPLTAARGRVLAMWVPGATVYRLDEGLLLRLPAALRVVCAVAPGLPLTREGSLLTAAPLTPEERKRLPLQEGILLVRNGEAVIIPLSDSVREDPADWLDLTAWQSVDVVSLGTPPAPPVIVAEAAPFDARTKLHGVPPASPQSAAVAKGLQDALKAEREGRTSSAEKRGEATAFPMPAMMRQMLERLAHLGEGPAGGGGQRGTGGSGADSAPPRPTLTVQPQTEAERLNPFTRWLKHTAARTLLMTGLARQVGQRQAEYLGRMMEMFEKGELDAALRHAIPLGGDSDQPAAPALSVPHARENLHISSGSSSSRMGLGNELLTDLKTLYRRAFEQLERAGRIEEAAFVLAELLHQSAEAVAFLERHNKLQLAAEIAESRKLSPGLIVRQWLLAGNRERAILIARRHHAFGAAVELLQRSHPEQAAEMRFLWAEANAESGDYAAAVDLLWQNPHTRERTLPWIVQALAFGGIPAARMLVRQLELMPEDAELHARILALLEDEEPEHAPERKEFAEILCTAEVTPRLAAFARAALRTMLRDSQTAPHLFDRDLLRRLQNYGADAALRADLPTLPADSARSPFSQREEPLRLEWEAHDTGAMPVYDAAFLSNGRTLVALGEAGVRLLTRDGRTAAHFNQPAHRLVVADGGQRAIAIAPRGELLRLAKLDLTALRATHWCEASIQTFTPDYDGSLWFVATATDFLAIDATSDRFQALWRTPELTGAPVQITRNILDCSLLLRQPQLEQGLLGLPALSETWWKWHFALPSLVMRDRQEVHLKPDLRFAFTRAIAPSGEMAELAVRPGEQTDEMVTPLPLLNLRTNGSHPFEMNFPGDYQPMQSVYIGLWLAVPYRDQAGVYVSLFSCARGDHSAAFTLKGAQTVSVRLTSTHLTLADDRGRVIVLDLATGSLLRDLRLH